MAVQLSDAAVIINNDAVPIEPNTLLFTEGLGEQAVRAASIGGGNVEPIYSNNVETSLSKVNFDMPSTVDNIARARQWKTNGNNNVIQITGRTVDGNVTRTFQLAALVNDYEVALGSDTVISVEFMSQPAI